MRFFFQRERSAQKSDAPVIMVIFNSSKNALLLDLAAEKNLHYPRKTPSVNVALI
jgi:hypothetical protein